MQVRYAWLVLGLTALSPGCSVVRESTRNLIIEPLQFNRYTDSCFCKIRDKLLAEDAWAEIVARDGISSYSKDYECGFIAGYRDYLYAGGNCEPPPMPPRHYWRIPYQNAEGHQAIQDWFAGFRHGAVVAQESGFRNVVVIPTTYVRVPAYGTLPVENKATLPMPDEILETPKPADKPAVPEGTPDKPKPEPGPAKPKPDVGPEKPKADVPPERPSDKPSDKPPEKPKPEKPPTLSPPLLSRPQR